MNLEHDYAVTRSYAKINIGLKIGEQRADGYHDIETIFKVISLADTITFEKNLLNKTRLFSKQTTIPLDDTNICAKAVRLLEEETGQKLGADIHLEKSIPIGAGLGGGSSNGACVLMQINQLYKLNLSDAKLMELAAALGSDVPFFVGFLLRKGNTALGKGRGEMLEFFQWDLTEKVLLIYPNIEISTAWAYQNFRAVLDSQNTENSSLNLTNKAKSIMFSAPLEKKAFLGNNFEPLVFAKHSKIRLLQEMLEKENAVFARMSGSGSAVFGLFDKARNLEKLVSDISGDFVTVCAFV